MNQVQYGKPTFANALKIFPHTPEGKEYLKIVRVRNGVASITNSHALIRRSVTVNNVPAVPDGCYDVRVGGDLIPTSNPEWMKYPDIDLVRPDGINPASGKPQIEPFCSITNEVLGFMIPLIQEIRMKFHGTVLLNDKGLWMRQNPQVGMAYPFGLPSPVEVNPLYLEFVLVEMLQYPMVYLLREIRHDNDGAVNTPLIFGLGWDNCGLIMPIRHTDDE